MFKGVESFFVVAFNPAGFVEVYGLPAAVGAIFMQQAILYNFKLQLPNSANDFAIVELIDKQLRHTLVHELLNAFVELFGFHGIAIFDIFKHFG